MDAPRGEVPPDAPGERHANHGSSEEAAEEVAGVLRPHPILEMLDVKVVDIDLPGPSIVSVILESEQRRRVLLGGAEFEGRLQLAIQKEPEMRRIRIALGDSRRTAMTTLRDDPFVEAAGGSGFFPVPYHEGGGRYLLMKASTRDGSDEKIVIVTEPRNAGPDAGGQQATEPPSR